MTARVSPDFSSRPRKARAWSRGPKRVVTHNSTPAATRPSGAPVTVPSVTVTSRPTPIPKLPAAGNAHRLRRPAAVCTFLARRACAMSAVVVR
ncbi:hypothetical protein SAVIM40S_07349 [Streptomyces avidinii]